MRTVVTPRNKPRNALCRLACSHGIVQRALFNDNQRSDPLSRVMASLRGIGMPG